MGAVIEKKSNLKPDVMSFRTAMMPKKQGGFKAYGIWSVSLFLVLFQFLLQLSSGQIVDGLMETFKLTALGGSSLVSAYYYVYVSLQTPAGVLMDRYGPRKLLTGGCFVLSCGCLLFASAPNFLIAFIGRMLMGGGAAFAFVGLLYLADKWFRKERFSLMTGLAEAAGMVGVLIGVFAFAAFVEHIGWRDCMYAATIVGFILCLLLGLIIRDMPANRRMPGPRPKRRVLPGLRVLIRMRKAWFNAIYSGLVFLLITAFASLWGVPFFQATHHLTLFDSTMYCSFLYLGTLISCPILGWVDTQVKHRRYIMTGFVVVAFFLMLIIILWATIPLPLLALCMFLLGVCASVYMLTFAVANEIAATRIRSASIGFVNTLSVGLSPIVQMIIGFILYLSAKHEHPFDMAHYTVHEFQMALMVIPFLLIFAAWLGWYTPSRKG